MIDLPTAISDTWNTPASLLAHVRAVMGGIDVDPASNDEAQAIVRATTFYTAEANGLAHEWPGRVYLNPPYSNPQPFISKLLAELDAGRTTEAIVLVNARTGAKWFQALAIRAWRCDIQKRVKFWRPDRPDGSTGRSCSVALYVGPNARRFARAFRPLGSVTGPARVSRNAASCSVCSRPVAASRDDARTCSAACRMKAYRRRKRLPCVLGGAPGLPGAA